MTVGRSRVARSVLALAALLALLALLASPVAADEWDERAIEAGFVYAVAFPEPDGDTVLLVQGTSWLADGYYYVLTLSNLSPWPLADILVLDEPTAALDGLTEKSIFEALPCQIRGKTLILVAHRLSTVVDCDRILLLNENRLVAEGTHGELMSMSGYYRELAACQLIPARGGQGGRVIPIEHLRRHTRP